MLAAAVIGAVGVLSLPWHENEGGPAGDPDVISHVDWTNADKSDTWPPDGPTPGPGYDGDGNGTPDAEEDGSGGDNGGNGDDGGDAGPTGEAGSPGTSRNGGDQDRSESGGLLDLAFPVQAALSVGLLGLAFLALLPGRRMPADLR